MIFFAKKATVDNNNDEVPHLEPKNINNTINKFNTSPIELAHIMRNIKKSNNSYCGVPGKFLSLIATPVSFVYYKILNGLFEIGQFPDNFKLGHICCIYKGATAGPMTSKNSWRPITLLPTLSKVAESVVHKRLLSHLMDNDLISHRQAAYLKGDSTIQQLSIIIHKIKMAWSKGEKIQGVFLDVSAAFDKAWHKGILAKLDNNGVTGAALSFFESYLTNRTQITVIDGVKSNPKPVVSGVPQGSRLGPILWILYYNDIVDNITADIYLFADDLCIFVNGPNIDYITDKLNTNLQSIAEWATNWKVSFSPLKSKTIYFSRQWTDNLPHIYFSDTIIPRVRTHRHLGVMLSYDLSWSEQVNNVCKKAYWKLSVLRSVSQLNRSTLDILYKLIIRSIIDYGLMLYYFNLNLNDKKRLDTLQYRAAKITTGAPQLSSSLKLNIELGWETINDRAKFLGLTLYHKIKIGATRPLARSCLPLTTQTITRSHGTYSFGPYKNAYFTNSFFPFFSKHWHLLPNTLKNCLNLNDFKTELKLIFKPPSHKHFRLGHKSVNTLMTLFRVGRTQLNSHRFSIGLSETDRCDCGSIESPSHFFLDCSLYSANRIKLVDRLITIIPNFSNITRQRQLELILFGIINKQGSALDPRNRLLTFAVQNFVISTNRFKKVTD